MKSLANPRCALNVAEGIVIGDCTSRHRHQEWTKFLQLDDDSTDPDLDLHLIARITIAPTSIRKETLAWRHPRHMHFIPTSSSGLEPGGAMVSRPDRPPYPSRRLSQRAGVDRSH